jgi:hypothetical protein
MRTTLDLEEDVLLAAKEIAASRGITAGQAVSELLRKALRPEAGGRRGELRNGVPVVGGRRGAAPITRALVNRLRDA